MYTMLSNQHVGQQLYFMQKNQKTDLAKIKTIAKKPLKKVETVKQEQSIATIKKQPIKKQKEINIVKPQIVKTEKIKQKQIIKKDVVPTIKKQMPTKIVKQIVPTKEINKTKFPKTKEQPQIKRKTGLRILNDRQQNKDKKVEALIVTFKNGQSYDQLFTQVQQKSIEGTKVQVYQCKSSYIKYLQKAFEGQPENEIDKRLIDTIKQLDSDCVVFNWQCCSGYAEGALPEGQDNLFRFLKKMIDRGHMCMFSDFSLKALIKGWNEKYELGPNPFVKTSSFDGQFEIRFNNETLKQCPSAQLQIVGDMAEGGKCIMHSLPDTIVYCIDSTKLKHEIYQLQVLTIVTNLQKPPKQHFLSKIGQFSGCAGHVLLKYPGKGMILTSMGHWIELMKLDTSEKVLFEIAEIQYGGGAAEEMKKEYSLMDQVSKKEWLIKKSKNFVSNQAPCNKMSKKMKKG